MRRHGWQLPYHPLQVVAIAVFFALAFAFYVFFMPFVGSKLLEIVAVALYSPLATIVFLLYVWCVAKNPADAGVLSTKDQGSSTSLNDKSGSIAGAGEQDAGLQSRSEVGKVLPSSLSSNQKGHLVKDGDSILRQHAASWLLSVCCCNVTSWGEGCKRKFSADVPVPEAEMLYCSLCKAEICIHSKHCRVCDKCVDGFDHHCRWLNNCVGRRNYNGFFALMVSALVMLVVQWSFGLWVLIHCFLNLRHFEFVIALKLGSSFSPVAYIVVIVLCTVLAMTATYPLGQLLCFHILLIKKGISTYDYIVAMREQEQKAGGESAQSPLTSPVSSVGTANSAASSVAAVQGRAWCTPPRLFFDHEGIYPPERSLSMKDVEPGVPSKASMDDNLRRKTSVRLSPWALASLNKEDVLRSASSARNRSSILRPLVSVNEKTVVAETDSSLDSSRDASVEFNLPSLKEKNASQNGISADLNIVNHSPEMSSWQSGKLPREFLEQLEGGSETDMNDLTKRGKKVLNPLQMEARNAFKTSQAFSSGGIVTSSPDSSVTSPEVRDPRGRPFFVVQSDWPWMQKPTADAYTQGGESSGAMSAEAKSLPCTPAKQVLVDVHHSL